MLLRNFDSAQGHCNGTRYVVKSASANVVEAVVACGSHKGKTLFIPRIVMSPSDNVFPFTMKRKQFPIRPAFAFTANKSQGQTLKRVGIFLPTQMFSHGQLYVAMSRVGKAEEVKILLTDSNNSFDQYGQKFVDNVVYSEIIKKV